MINSSNAVVGCCEAGKTVGHCKESSFQEAKTSYISAGVQSLCHKYEAPHENIAGRHSLMIDCVLKPMALLMICKVEGERK